MKTKNDIEKEIKTIFETQFEEETIVWDKKWADYNFSSIQLIYFLKDLESHFGPIPLAEFYELQSGNDLRDYLLNRYTSA